MNITAIDKGALIYEDDKGMHLAFPTHMHSRQFRGTDTVALKNSDGIIVDGQGRVSTWTIENFVEHEDGVLVVGPWVDGTKPFDSRKLTPATLARLLPAIRAMGSESDILGGLYTPALRWLDDGGVMMFPPKLAAWLRDTETQVKNRDHWELWNHPDNRGMAGWSFSLGIMAWNAIHPSDPFAGEEGELRRERIRHGTLTPIEVHVPDIRQDISVFLKTALCSRADQTPTLDEWDAMLRKWQREGLTENLSSDQIEERRTRAVRDSKISENRLNTRRWIRKSGWKVLVSVTALVLVTAFLSAPVKKALEKPLTMGMPPIEVAAAYYAAIDSLDAEMMDDCLAPQTGKNDLRQVNMVFVTQRVRQGYERIGDLPKASEWIAAGKPAPENGMWPWGITNLQLRELSQDRIEAEYIFWTQPETDDENNPPTEPAAIQRRDILSFAEGRWSWEISNIDREERLLLSGE